MFDKFRRRAAEGDSNNPMIRAAFRNANRDDSVLDGHLLSDRAETMTVSGAVNKTFLLTVLMLLTAVVGFTNPSPLMMWGGAIGGFVLVLIASFSPKNAV